MLNNKKSYKKMSIENHRTAAWANIKNTKPISNVPLVDETDADNAKDWVEENKK